MNLTNTSRTEENEPEANDEGEVVYDVIVIGGGPAGLTAAIYCREHNLSVMVIEGKQLGGQLSQLYPTKFIMNYASYPEIRAGYLADLMLYHARSRRVAVKEKEVVRQVAREERGEDEEKIPLFRVSTFGPDDTPASRSEYSARAIVIATGMGMFEPSKLNVPGEMRFTGRGVFYSVPNLEIYRGKRVLVIGGGDTAVENAVGLAGICEVTLMHRRDRFRATETNLDLLHTSPVTVKTPFVLEEITGDRFVKGAVLKNASTDETEEMPVDAVIINVGFSPDLSIIDELGVENNGKYITISRNDMHTNIDGIFACGDIVDYPGKVRQVHPALGEAATAAMEAYKFIKKPYWARQ